MKEDDSVKLVKMGKPQPTNHPDPRMHWTLDDVKRMFPTRQYFEGIPLAFPRSGGQV